MLAVYAAMVRVKLWLHFLFQTEERKSPELESTNLTGGGEALPKTQLWVHDNEKK